MALPDDVFGPIPSPLVDKWGIPITYVKTGTDSYNTTTGTITSTDTTVSTKALLTTVKRRESEGLYQSGDILVYIAASSLPAYQPTIRDRIQYDDLGVTREARIIDITTYRGTAPIFHSFVVRPE